jgi:hypothetical protein
MMENEEIQAFNSRLSQWISAQGFWFQLRYAFFGRGNIAVVIFHLMQLVFRVAIFLLVIAGGLGSYVFKRTGKQVFTDEMTESARKAIGAKEAKIDGFIRTEGELRMNRFAALGSPDSFFESLEAGTIHCSMGLTDGIFGKWNAGALNARTCKLTLKAGADDADLAKREGIALFSQYPKFSFTSIDVLEANMFWGYSERTNGRIEKSHLLAQRTENGGWKLQFRGGYFTQNWLHHLDIDELLIHVDHDHLTIEKGEFHRDSGQVSMHNVVITGGERPEIHGTAKIKNLPIDAILPAISSGFIEGSISADVTISGSTNTSEGVAFQGQALFDGSDVITLRERIHLLRALSVVDVFNSYRKIDFREGSFTFKTGNGMLDVSDVDLKAKNLFTMQGRLRVRPMTPEEINAELQRSGSVGGSPIFDRQEGGAANTNVNSSEDEFTLKNAGKEERKEHNTNDANPSVTPSLFDRMAQMNLSYALEEQEKNRLSRQLRFDGGFRVTIPADAFERAQQLREDNPVDPSTGRIPLTVPVEGTLYDITLKQAEEIYQKGRRQE